MNIAKYLLSVAAVAFFSATSLSAEMSSSDQNAVQPQSLADQAKGIEDSIDVSDWKIRNGCVMLRRIKRIRFVDDQTALLSMRGKKQIVLRLQRNCPGIKNTGFMHRTVGSRLCSGFDRFTVMGTGYSCRVESLEPYIEIEELPRDQNLD
jgi:hypothetical protein